MASLVKRGKTFYAQYYVNGKQKRVNLNTTTLQIAKEKIRQIESAQLRLEDIPFPTKPPFPNFSKNTSLISGHALPSAMSKKYLPILLSASSVVCIDEIGQAAK